MGAKKLEVEKFVDRMRVHFIKTARYDFGQGVQDDPNFLCNTAIDCFDYALQKTTMEWLRRYWK